MTEDSISARLHERIRRDFPDRDAAQGVEGDLRALAVDLGDSRQDTERLLAAAVLAADGDLEQFRTAVALAREDWRDLLMWAGLGNANWRGVLDERLSSA